MKSTEELKNLYESDLKPQLAELEAQRKTIKKLWTGAIIVAAILFLFVQAIPNQTLMVVTIILGIIGILFLAGYGVVKFYAYRKAFKSGVVTKIIELINPDYKYDANRHVDSSHFNNSKIFTKHPDRIKGDDYVSGTIDKTDFEFSELKAEYKTETTKDGQKQTEWHTIFSGLFFHADFNKKIEGTTFVLPDTAEKLFGKFGQKLQKASSRGELVKLENPEFEKEFVVYSSGQQEARYILTPVMMEAMVNLHKKYKRKMHFSFIGERVYCATSFNQALFEPRIRKSGVNFADIEEMYGLFSLIETIIHEMNLNTRIWTKD